ncbi:uncharacterized protein LOC117587912 isoform X2 [Drosophila guanche]|uniref:uncharacterized protein LOC117587912 isoform X2 n=1 Tax=Drosophila guanche TaxID=7266 RepID=UPI001471D4C6|nr:uncharacterized protein LOC117587912 isoform X2 [Drosophila guanche]
MVRRKVDGVRRQLSLTAYQQLMAQGSNFRHPARQPHMVRSMDECWQNTCWNKMSALPRMSVLEPSRRGVTRARRQLMWSPREIVTVPQPKGMRMVPGNYVRQQPQQQVQLQQYYPPRWGRSQWEGTRRSHQPAVAKLMSAWGDSQRSAANAQQHQNSASSQDFLECPSCQTAPPACYFESEASRFAAAANRIEQQQKELHLKQLQLQKLQDFHLSPQPSREPAPVGILKKPTRPEGGQSLASELNPKMTKRVTIHGMHAVDGKRHERVLDPADKPKSPEKGRQKEPQRNYLREQHPQPQQQQSPSTFNFGKFVGSFIDFCDRSSESRMMDCDPGSFTYEGAKPKKRSKVRSNAGSEKETRSLDSPSATSLNGESQTAPESPKVERFLRKTKPETTKRQEKRSARELGDNEVDRQDSGTSTSTLTTEKSKEELRTPIECVEKPNRSRLLPKTPNQSQTSIRQESEECTGREGRCSLDVHEGSQASDREQTHSLGKKNRIRKVNINQLLQNQELQDGSSVWASLMQLVGQMCDPPENEEEEEQQQENDFESCEEQRMMAGYGTQKKKRKQYSVYLMVNSDDEDEEEYSSPKQDTASPDIPGESHSPNQQDDYANECYRLFQEEQCKLGRRKRKRRSSSRIKELAYPYPTLPPGQHLRRPLHWPKPDMSKPLKRPQHPRTTSKPPAKKRGHRSISAMREQQHAQRVWGKGPQASTSCMMYPIMNSTMRQHY